MTIDINELKKCPIFGCLAAEDLEKIRSACRSVSRKAEEVIFREGEPCHGFYIVTRGAARVFKIGPSGRERTLHVVRAPHSFAEAALFGRGIFPAFASAVEDSSFILVAREPFLRVLQDHPAVVLRLMESFSLWMHRLLDQLEDETFLNARAKLAHYLLRLSRRKGIHEGRCDVLLDQPKKDVALQLGMAAETYSRAQADLEGRGLIRPTGRTIEIPDLEALELLLLGDGAEG